MGALKYSLALIFAPLAVWTAWYGGTATFLVPLIVFALVPLLELVVHGSQANPAALHSRIYDFVCYAGVFIHWGALVTILYFVQTREMSTVSLVGTTFSLGILCGAYGINIGHELGHRKTGFEKFLAKASLLSSLYMHFFIEHNRGHHKNVATDNDPASARKGEWLAVFWLRSMVGGYASAWRIENARCRRKLGSWMHWRNEMIWYTLIQGGLLLGLTLISWRVLLVFVGAALIGALLLETINYVEHYGLRRMMRGHRYESVTPIHSWNSNHTIGRLLLFELTRHSDHHAHAGRKYQHLRHFDQSPQLPTGYPGMILLALVPPVWFYVMDRRLPSQ